jgi:hypothetical protein
MKGETMHNIEDLHELCETISREIGDANEKIRQSGGKLSGEDLTYLDKLTHTLKSLKTTIAMVEAEDGESGRYMPHSYGMYGTNGGYNGNSYRRSRDSMGRYTSRRGYSYDDGMIEELRSLMESAPDERTKSEFRQFIAKMEKM